MESQEGYKYDICRDARRALDFGRWKHSDIGSGRIATVVEAIELPQNNLVPWQARYGVASRPHHALCVALEAREPLGAYEQTFYDLFWGTADAQAFQRLMAHFGRRYALLAYYFFLKDRTRYMPIAPRYFDQAFHLLGVDFTTSHQCSWDNYTHYNGLLAQVQLYLTSRLQGEVSLLDAHAFVWMLVSQMRDVELGEPLREYARLSPTERDALTHARIGQGWFRQQLLAYWGTCAVTACQDSGLLVASHIKPWRECDVREALDPYNGLLLSPSLDAAFDGGYITFVDSGEIVLSPVLRPRDAAVLGLHATMRLRQVAAQHLPYLRYHREHCFRAR